MKKPTPQTVNESHIAAFTGKLNMVDCANHCGLTIREFKMTFREFLKYNPATYETEQAVQLSLDV